MTSFLKIVLFIVVLVATIGFVLPALFSADNDIAIIIGVVVSAAVIWMLLFPTGLVDYLRRLGPRDLGLIALVFLIGATTACSKVPAGHVGVKVYLLGGSKGVDHEELGVGRYWVGVNEELYLFPTFTQNYVWTKSEDEGSPTDESITFQTVEGLSVNGDFGITYRIDPKKVNILFQTYRRGLDEITDTFLRNIVRDEIVKVSSKMKVESVYGEGKETMMVDINKRVAERVVDKGLLVENIYVIGELRLPQAVVSSLNEKIAATQKAIRVENEIREAEAQAKKIIVAAEASAKANRLISESITPNIVRWRELDVQQLGLGKWNGTMPLYTGSGVPLIQLPSPK